MAEQKQSQKQKRNAFPRTHRLRSRADFAAVFDAKIRASAGPLTLYALANQLGHPRLGTSIGRRAGTAVRRNRIKRLLRESFRLMQHDLPPLDLVVVVRPHTPLPLPEYRALLRDLVRRVQRRMDL